MKGTPVKIGNCILGYRKYRRPKRNGAWPLWGVRRVEIERLIVLRHGGVCDTDDGALYLTLAAHTVAAGKKTVGKEGIVRWARFWVPKLHADEHDAIIEQALRKPLKFTADRAAAVLRITKAERDSCKIRTMGAIDFTKEQRIDYRKQRKREAQRERDRARRAERGAIPREMYIANSKAQRAREMGVRRSSFYKKKPGVERRKAKDLPLKIKDHEAKRQVVCTA